MPTIEIVCLGQQQPLEVPDFSFAVEWESEPISHRPLFSDEFKSLDGYIYHLGNPYLREMEFANKTFFAYQLLESMLIVDGRLKFKSPFAEEVRQLFALLLKASSAQKIIFSSDYQFGPEIRRIQRPLRYEAFWRCHDAGKLCMNARYFVQI